MKTTLAHQPIYDVWEIIGCENTGSPDYLWLKLPTILALPKPQLRKLEKALAALASMSETINPNETLAVAEIKRRRAKQERHWWDCVSRFCLSKDYSSRQVIAELVPHASNLN